MEKITKADLRQPDLFVESASTFWVFVEKNFKAIMTLFILAVIVSVGVIAKSYFDERAEKRAVNELYPIESKVVKAKEGFDRAKNPAAAPPQDKDAPAPKKATGDLQADYGSNLTDLENFASSHQAYVAGAEAGLISAAIYSDYQKPEKALEILSPLAQKFEHHHSVLIYGLLQMALGTAQAAKNDCKSAIDSWQKIIKNDKLKFLEPDAQLKAGACAEALGDMPQAKEHYEKASGGRGNVAKNAKTMLRALDVKK